MRWEGGFAFIAVYSHLGPGLENFLILQKRAGIRELEKKPQNYQNAVSE